MIHLVPQNPHKKKKMKNFTVFAIFLAICFFLIASISAEYDGPIYDFTAYTECKSWPEKALYGGGILKHKSPVMRRNNSRFAVGVYTPAYILYDLTQGSIYSFSSWVMIEGEESSVVRASLKTENETYSCIGTVLARNGCWSFLKGGFVLDWPSNESILVFQNSDDMDVKIEIANAALQPFTQQEWRTNRQYIIDTVIPGNIFLSTRSNDSALERAYHERKRAVTIHVSDDQGGMLQGAQISLEQISKDFPLGSAIASTILGNLPYQKWFVERFNAAVFENELKWYATEPTQGKLNYTTSDQMLEFVHAHQIVARGHNIFWEDPKYTPAWVRNLSSLELKSAVLSRIQSLMTKYKAQFIHWDVSNENLHWDFYEQRLGPNATLEFFKAAHQADPLATLFVNEFNVVETCSDEKSTVDGYIARLRELQHGGVYMDGIGLEAHFTVPNPALIRAILDKLATLNLPIWLTEVDISNSLSQEMQAFYLEQVLREGFSHPSVNGIMLWTALHPKPKGCYQMCLTDDNFRNLPAGDVVDRLLKEWESGEVKGQADEHGSFSFYGFLGEYKVLVRYGNRTTTSTFSLGRGDETKHFSIQL